MVYMIEDFQDRMNTKYVGIGFILLLAFSIGGVVQFTSNSSASYEPHRQSLGASGGVPTSLEYSGDSAEADKGGSGSIERKVITRYSIDLEVPDVEDAMEQTEDVTRSYAGFVDSSSFDRETGVRGTLTVRVPENNVTEFLDDLNDKWKVESSRKSSQDVTDRYTELQLELKNRRQELQQLERLMNQTNRTEDLIKIQERMSELRSRIQYLENQLTDLDRRVEYTEVTISYEEPQPFSTEFEIRESFREAYRGLFNSINLMIVGLGYLLPFLAIGAIIYKGRNLVRQL